MKVSYQTKISYLNKHSVLIKSIYWHNKSVWYVQKIASITTGSTSTFLILLLFEIYIIADYNSSFSSSFSFMQHLNLHDELISLHLLVFLSVTVISGLLFSKHLSVYMGKSHSILILQSTDSSGLSGLHMYHFYTFSDLHSSNNF